MSKVEEAVSFAVSIAKDDTHGYSQANRNGNPDYDCSSLTIAAFKNVGIPVGNATYTGNMYNEFRSNGWLDVTAQINLYTGSGLIAGDVLLNTVSHTCIYIGNGQVVNARTDTDGMSGDSHGDEIRIQSYWNFPWNYVLRYPEGSTSTEVDTPTVSTPIYMTGTYPLLTVRYASETREDVKALQTLLTLRGFDIDVTGVFDVNTQTQVKQAQAKYGLLQDGECGSNTWSALIKG